MADGSGLTDTFDFASEAQKALADFPRLSDKAVFFSLAENAAATTATQFRMYGTPAALALARKNSDYIWNAAARARKNHTSGAFETEDGTLRGIVYNENDSSFRYLYAEPHAQVARSIFNHELGHILSRGGFDITDINPLGESIADAFSVLRGLQQAPYNKSLHLRHAWWRACGVLDGNTFYATAPVIDRILADSDKADISSLTSSETIATAEDYARKYKPDSFQLEDCHRELRRHGGAFNHISKNTVKQLLLLSETALRTRSTFVFATCARLVSPLLHHNGMELNGYHLQLQESRRQSLLHDLSSRAEDMGVDYIARDLRENRFAMLVPDAPQAAPRPCPAIRVYTR